MALSPLSPEGRLALQVASAPGMCRRAGQAAVIVGLDWQAVQAVLPPGCDRDRVLALLRCFEGGMVDGASEKALHDMEDARARAEAERGR